MPTPRAERASANVPSELESVFLTAQCPPGETRPASRAPRLVLGEHRVLPPPPGHTSTATTSAIDRLRLPPSSAVETPQDQGGLTQAVPSRESARSHSTHDTGIGATEHTDGVTSRVRRHGRPTRHSEILASNESSSSSNTLEALRLLEAGRHRDNRSSWTPSSNRLNHAYSALSPSRPSFPPSTWQDDLARFDAAPRRSEEISPESVRWPVTSDIPSSLLESTRAQLSSSHHLSGSGPTSTQEENLRRAYMTLQAQSSTHPLRNAAHNYARLASSRDWMSTSQRAASPYVPESASHIVSEDVDAPREIDSRDLLEDYRPTLSFQPGSMRPRPQSTRQLSGFISDRSDMIMNLPPLTPLSSSEGKEYDFPATTTSRAPAVPDSSEEASTSPYQPLENHRFGAYQPSCLHSGATFVGTQCSDRQEYSVKVQLKHVDMDESFLCGHLIIEGLTPDHPKLETYFEGEIIGSKYTFTTRHPDWGASEKQDLLHWNRFAAWKPIARASRHSEFDYKDFAEREHIFMRWKEYFLVPDHRVTAISGASFEGFYYICFNQRTGTFSGIYYHAKSERWQQLDLKYVEDNSRDCVPAVEMA